MLTVKQKKWIAHLPNNDTIGIKPYDPSSPEKFEKVKKRIQSVLGGKTRVEHCGATRLGISGQDEIDIYLPVLPDKFDPLLVLLQKIFGEPKSLYPLERARFATFEDGKHIDVFLINEECDGWKNGVKFETYLKTHPRTLETYRQLKEAGDGLSTRAYYKRKITFINECLAKYKLSTKSSRRMNGPTERLFSYVNFFVSFCSNRR